MLLLFLNLSGRIIDFKLFIRMAWSKSVLSLFALPDQTPFIIHI